MNSDPLHESIAALLKKHASNGTTISAEEVLKLVNIEHQRSRKRHVFVMCAAQLATKIVDRMGEEPAMAAMIISEAYHFIDHHWPKETPGGKTIYQENLRMAEAFVESFISGEVPEWLEAFQDCELEHRAEEERP